MRRRLVAGNWKMHGDAAIADALCAGIRAGVGGGHGDGVGGHGDGGVEVVVCPPYPLLAAASAALFGDDGGTGNGGISVGAQDVDAHADGAFTGQVSAAMLTDAGCRYCLVGHSERRALFGEDDALVAQKTRAAAAAGLRPIVCVGETQTERDAGDTFAVVGKQLDAVAGVIGGDAVVAYEPVWAIGSGVTATPAQAQEVHAFIRARLADHDAALADCRIIYGGSMKPDNARALINESDIDGGLVGGASLVAADFVAICNAAAVVTVAVAA